MNDVFTISVIIPAYNAQEYISRTLNSVVTQSLPPLEIIVIDDGSTDNTDKITQSFGDKITYIRQENQGVAAARNLGIAMASAQWVAFLDSDDEWLPDKLQKQTDILKHNPELNWAASNFIKCLCKDNRKEPVINTEKAQKLLADKDYFPDFFPAQIQSTPAWTGTVIARKETLIKAGPFRKEASPAEDIDLWWRIAFENPAIGYCPEPLAIYHMDIPLSISQGLRPLGHLVDLLEHNFAIAQNCNQQYRLAIVASHMVKCWIRAAFFEGRHKEINILMNHFDNLLSQRFKTIAKLMLTLGPLTTYSLRTLSSINRKFLIRRKITRRPGPVQKGMN